MHTIIKTLHKTILFKGKTLNEVEILLKKTNFKVKIYDNNSIIFGVEDPTTQIGIILSGAVEVQKNLSTGKTVIILNHEKGSLIGQGSVFSRTHYYPCNMYAKKNTKILIISKESFLSLLASDTLILNNFLHSFANRILLLNQQTELLSYSSIHKKIAFSLLHMFTNLRNGQIIKLPYTKKEWSEHLNVSRPSLFRELKTLCEQDILHIQKRTITILDEEALVRILFN